MLTEGIRDPGIFKAVFLAGGPGSGKSFVVGKTALTSFGLKVVNSDMVYELALAAHNMEPTPENIYSDKGQAIRVKAKKTTARLMDSYLNGRLGLVIDGTGKDYDKISSTMGTLQAIGYDCMMIFVNTDEQTALQRNSKRERTLPAPVVSQMWKGVQNNIGKFQNLFGRNFIVVDNSDGSNIEGATLSAYRQVGAWVRRPPQNRVARQWIQTQMRNRNIREEQIDEKLDSSKNDIGDYIHDFKKSDAPQFKGKGKAKRRSMAVAAYLASKRKKGERAMGESMTPQWAHPTLAKTILRPHYKKAYEILDSIVTRKKKEGNGKLRHPIEWYASLVGRQVSDKIDPRTLAKLYRKEEIEYNPQVHEWGTPEGTDQMKSLTPGQKNPKEAPIKVLDQPTLRKLNVDDEYVKEENEIEIKVDKDNSKHEYRVQNADEAQYFLDSDDISELEKEAENITYEELEELGVWEDDDDMCEECGEQECSCEEPEEIDEALSVQGRMKRRFAARRNRQKLKVARMIAMRRGSTPGRLKKRATRGARGMVYKRLLRGRNRKNLPPAEKARLETMVQRFAPLVSRLATKMLPNMRKMEIQRMKSRSTKKAAKSKKYKAATPIAKKQKATKFKVKK